LTGAGVGENSGVGTRAVWWVRGAGAGESWVCSLDVCGCEAGAVKKIQPAQHSTIWCWCKQCEGFYC